MYPHNRNENGAWQTAWKQYTTGQRALLKHMLFGVVHFGVHMKALQRLRTCRSFFGDQESCIILLDSIKGHSRCCYELFSNYEPSLIHHFALEVRREESEAEAS